MNGFVVFARTTAVYRDDSGGIPEAYTFEEKNCL